jgi:flagellar biosynthesis/type III secretory pathway chaperone
MSGEGFARLAKRLNGLNENELANTLHALDRHHENHAEGEGVDDRLFENAKRILEDVDEIKRHLKALQTGNLSETQSKREMREIKLEIDRIVNDLYDLRTLVRNERDDLDSSDVYLAKLADVEASIDSKIEYLRDHVDRIDGELGS